MRDERAFFGRTLGLTERRETLFGGTLGLSVRRSTLGGSCDTLFVCRVGVCVRREARRRPWQPDAGGLQALQGE